MTIFAELHERAALLGDGISARAREDAAGALRTLSSCKTKPTWSAAYHAWLRAEEYVRQLGAREQLLRDLFETPGALVPTGSADDRLWKELVWACEAGVRVLGPRSEDPASARLLLVAEWTLFLALSAPLRVVPGAWADTPWGVCDDHTDDGQQCDTVVRILSVVGVEQDLVAGELQESQSMSYLARVRQLRARLADTVLHFQDSPLLRECSPANLERIASLLVFAGTTGTEQFTIPDRLPHHPERPVEGKRDVRVTRGADSPQRPGSELGELVESFYLPRFAIATAWRAAAAHRHWRWGTGASGIVGALCVIVAAVLFVIGEPGGLWAVFATAAAPLIYVPFAVAPKIVAMTGLLRVAPSVAIGVLLVMTLDRQWWGIDGDALSSRQYMWAAIILTLLAFGYLYTEARGHDVGWAQAFGRAGAVFVIVALNALLVTLVALAWIFPVFSASGGESILASLSSVSPGRRLAELLAVVSLASVVGLFSQVLWDEKTITAPLAHMSWRR